MDAKIVFRKMQRNVVDYGFGTFLEKIFEYILSPLYLHRVYRLYCVDLENDNIQSNSIDNIRFKLVDQKDLDMIKQIEDMEEWLKDKVEKKLYSNGLCLVALDNKKVAGFNLISFGDVFIPLIKQKRTFKKDEAWSEQITVHKDYRRSGIASALRYNAFSQLKKAGIKKFFGGTLVSNIASLELARRVGFRELKDIQFIRILGYKMWRENAVVR